MASQQESTLPNIELIKHVRLVDDSGLPILEFISEKIELYQSIDEYNLTMTIKLPPHSSIMDLVRHRYWHRPKFQENRVREVLDSDFRE